MGEHLDDQGGHGLREALRWQVLEVQYDVASCHRLERGLEIGVVHPGVAAELAIEFERRRHPRRVGPALERVALVDEPEMIAHEGYAAHRHDRHRGCGNRGRSAAHVAEKAPQRCEHDARPCGAFRPASRSSRCVPCHLSIPRGGISNRVHGHAGACRHARRGARPFGSRAGVPMDGLTTRR